MAKLKLINSFFISALLTFSTLPAIAQDNNNGSNNNNQINVNVTEGRQGDGTTTSMNPNIPTPEEDQIITNSIKNHIAKSSVLSKLKVNVNTEKGVVTLTGNVNSDIQASLLVELAQSIIGVSDVNSELTVPGSQQVLADTLITAKVKGLLIRENMFGTHSLGNISVETKNGVVYLTGHIKDKAHVDKAISLIKTVKGTKQVEYKFTKFVPLNTPEHKTQETNQNESQ